jgi:hypothetical protein
MKEVKQANTGPDKGQHTPQPLPPPVAFGSWQSDVEHANQVALDLEIKLTKALKDRAALVAALRDSLALLSQYGSRQLGLVEVGDCVTNARAALAQAERGQP